ncbi:MAG: hypothetical protein IKL65_01335 [Bacilli bacterium]|nr:hypothetical protein [Bacilli bacterium]
MSLNYNITETFKLLLKAFKYDIFLAIIISSILFVIILIFNKNNKKFNYILLVINVLLIGLICYFYIGQILTFKFTNPMNNMYFYFFNSIMYLIITTLVNFKTKYRNINYVFYGLVLINLLYSLFMTHYLNNIDLIVIGNIFPMIKFGNIVYLLYYIFLIICFGRFLWEKK